MGQTEQQPPRQPRAEPREPATDTLEQPGRSRRDSAAASPALLTIALVAVLLAVATGNLWLVGAALVPMAAFVLREQSPELAARSTAAALAAALSLILLGLGIVHA